MNLYKGISLLILALFFSNANGKDPALFTEWGELRIPPDMVRLSYSYGMQHGGYYDKYFTVHEVSTNVFAATPAWTPLSREPIPLPVHQACAIYFEWQKKQHPNIKGDALDTIFELMGHIGLSNSARWPPEGLSNQECVRWFYTFSYKMNQEIIILLDGTLVLPRVVDLRTESEKKEYEKRTRNRRY